LPSTIAQAVCIFSARTIFWCLRCGSAPALENRFFASTFGPAVGLAGLPVAVASRVLDANLRDDQTLWMLAKLTASLLVAGSAVLVFLIAARFVSTGRALLLALAYALGTCVWSISSRALYQQTPALFFLSLGSFFMIRGETAWARGGAAGLAFAIAAACRPTCALVGLVAAAFLLKQERRSFAACAAGALPVGLALLAYNLYYFGSPFSFGQITQPPLRRTQDRLAGTMADPGVDRGRGPHDQSFARPSDLHALSRCGFCRGAYRLEGSTVRPYAIPDRGDSCALAGGIRVVRLVGRLDLWLSPHRWIARRCLRSYAFQSSIEYLSGRPGASRS
jgi:uncharacterized membrane protein